jgi:phosphoglycolate phosphatase-like HAD superfamily hydrolase
VYEAVVFDNDGVLVGGTRGEDMRRAARQAFEAHGIEDPEETHVAAVAYGVSLADLRWLVDAHNVDAEGFWETRDRYASAFQLASIRDGEKQPYDDVGVLRELDVPMAVVSSNQEITLRFLLEHHGLAEAFVGIYGREPTLVDVARKKPEPHFVSRALEDLQHAHDEQLDPGDVVMVGDNDSDVQAAHAAGIDAAFIRREHRVDHDLRSDPEHELDDLHDLRSLLDGR